ncbi:DUF2807 domain-containing protein [Phenylobacterium hankyongense]|uniref:DUF2807 domain-containing protein n=1 Tax=Phenylobacterium hankyongense TaxID=1813876 RepID=A0A328B202_9CAUL|nr:DUF2807 domain-containing protein [Phenylobacterium hankyongense]RAK61223.1 DUF2807 domain-containing protein [Phenylobacterium hankyongense]
MIRVLIMIAVAGFIVAVASLSTAIAIGGPDAIARGVWSWAPGRGWNVSHDGDRWGGRHAWADGGPQTSRAFAWTGGEALQVDVPADVRYTQAPGPAKLTVTGPRAAVDSLSVQDGRIGFGRRHHGHHWGRVVIVMTAPNVTRFELHASNKLTIDGYRQDVLRIDLSGDADVTASGETKLLELGISGSADADLSGLKTAGADVDITGSGEATLAPTEWAKLNISGSGDVNLLTHPARLETDVSGSGRIRQAEAQATPAPSPSPAPAPAPKTR